MDETTTPSLIYDLSKEDWLGIMAEFNQPKFRVGQIWEGIYQKSWNEPEQFTILPTSIRNMLKERLRFTSLSIVKELHSSDHETSKYLFALKDGHYIETVWMKYRDRNTLCISTQAGCAMNCSFCATGQMGFKRSLSNGEIVEQVMYFARLLEEKSQKVTNIVFMGMGEPFHNYENVIAAIDCLNDENGWNFGARRMTISTVGIIPRIRQFADEKRQVNLAVSLHSIDPDQRSSMMPVNKKYSIDELIEACHYYVQVTHRRITFEWALIAGVNDSVETAKALAKKLKGLLCHVNVIPLNPTTQFNGIGSPMDQIEVFRSTLESCGIPCTVRLRRGIDINAGCGQLASDN
jgi:23S rRNA (adenine2503-C2)-methyltransferase